MKLHVLYLLLLAVILMSSCNKKKNHPGYIYFPDMTYSQAYETYTPNPVFKNGQTLQAPVEGTISREMVPFEYRKDERELAGKELENPFAPNEENLARGKRQFGIFCIHCHGEKGDGMGFLRTSGKFPYPVRSLLTERVQDKPDGEIYHVITMGFGVMGSHGGQVKPDDRWKIALYVKHVLGKNRE